MTEQIDPSKLVGRRPDERLLDADYQALPDAAQPRLPATRPFRGRALLVGAGATLTGLTLIGGLVLLVAGAVDAIGGGFRALDLAALVLGAVLVATHWGWVHVAEGTAQALDARRERPARAGALAWLQTIEPYTRYTIATEVLEDGSIRIARSRHRPVAAGPSTFTFVREPDGDEVHEPDESGAVIAERAETLRHRAALDTARERERWEIVARAYEAALLDRDDEAQRLAARRAASRALSEQINAGLRDPPVME